MLSCAVGWVDFLWRDIVRASEVAGCGGPPPPRGTGRLWLLRMGGSLVYGRVELGRFGAKKACCVRVCGRVGRELGGTTVKAYRPAGRQTDRPGFGQVDSGLVGYWLDRLLVDGSAIGWTDCFWSGRLIIGRVSCWSGQSSNRLLVRSTFGRISYWSDRLTASRIGF